MPNLNDRGAITATHARCADHPHLIPQSLWEPYEKLLSAHHFTDEAVAYPDRDFGWRRFPFFNNIEVRVERRHLVDLGQCQAHLVRQGG